MSQSEIRRRLREVQEAEAATAELVADSGRFASAADVDWLAFLSRRVARDCGNSSEATAMTAHNFHRLLREGRQAEALGLKYTETRPAWSAAWLRVARRIAWMLAIAVLAVAFGGGAGQ